MEKSQDAFVKENFSFQYLPASPIKIYLKAYLKFVVFDAIYLSSQ
jgi:hypothetical protein